MLEIVCPAWKSHNGAMQNTPLQQLQDWPCIEFVNLDCRQPEEVGSFLLKLIRAADIDEDLEDLETAEAVKEWDKRLLRQPWRQHEFHWNLQAPMKRMARLLWEYLNPGKIYARTCTWNIQALTKDSRSCAKLIRIQKRLSGVLKQLAMVVDKSGESGQLAWGESFFLTGKQRALVRSQLKKTRLELLEQESDYLDMVRARIRSLVLYVAKYYPPVLDDPDRIYVGEGSSSGISRGPLVWVEDKTGERQPLRCLSEPYQPSQYMNWGYSGHGTSGTARGILTDATGGNVVLAKQLTGAFVDDFIIKFPQNKDFRLARVDVLDWIVQKTKRTEPEIARAALALRKAHADHHEALIARLVKVSTQDLRSQRFDVVPTDFESSLYVDFCNMAQRRVRVMICHECEEPMSVADSTRGRHQLSRWEKGQPVYHPGCFDKSREDKKRVGARLRAQMKRAAGDGQ